MKTRGIGHTDIGRHRRRNEDSLFADDELGLYAVSDGMGGHAAGDVASSMAVQAVARYVSARRDALTAIRLGAGDDAQLLDILRAAVVEAGQAVHATAGSNDQLTGMGCTLTAVLIGTSSAAMVHVGDSRLYRERRGWVQQISLDHNVEQELKSRGIVGLAQLRFSRAPANSLTRALGLQKHVIADHALIDLEPGDRLVLCTDGLSGYLTSPHQLSVLLDIDSDQAVTARRLIDFANTAGGRDNVTAIVVTVPGQPTTRSLGQAGYVTRTGYPTPTSPAC